jgi:hypothetical protein
MKDRLITLLCAVGAFALFYALFIGNEAGRAEEASRPTTSEHRENGYLGVVTWLERTGVPVVKLRRRFDRLPDMELRTSGNLMVTTLPYQLGLRDREIAPLFHWVGAGNTLLVMAALGDTPDWALDSGGSLVHDLARITELNFAALELQDEPEDEPQGEPRGEETTDSEAPPAYDEPFEKPQRHRLVPRQQHHLFEGVSAAVAESEYPADDWRASLPRDGFFVTLAHEEPSGAEGMWMRRYGFGTIIVSTYASLFTNQLVDEGNNARLFANLVRQAVHEDGAVIFDDVHQGLSELQDAEAFFSDERLHTTLWLMILLWLVWVLGATRLRPAPAPPPAPRESTLVAAIGGYLTRVLRPAQAGLRLCELFFNDVHRRLGQPEDGTPVWEWLLRQPGVEARDVEALRGYYEKMKAGRRVDLRRIQGLALQLQEQLE